MLVLYYEHIDLGMFVFLSSATKLANFSYVYIEWGMLVLYSPTKLLKVRLSTVMRAWSFMDCVLV